MVSKAAKMSGLLKTCGDALVSTIKVNGREVVQGGEVDLSVGEFIMLDLKIINHLLEPVCDADYYRFGF